jgi:hypothetical protein
LARGEEVLVNGEWRGGGDGKRGRSKIR